MRCKSLVLVLTAGLGGLASAQPGPPPAPPPPPVDTTTTTTTTPEPPPPEPTPTPTPAPTPAPTVVAAEPERSDRPEGLSIGFGLGYALPTSLETPNRTSARLRLASGLTFEPMVSLANSTQKVEMGGVEAETKTTEFGVQILGRLPIITHNKVDFELLATLGFTNVKTNPPLNYDTTTVTTFGLGWGAGIGYWLSRHWQLSMSVTNPLVEYERTKEQQMMPGMTDTRTETTLGVIFVPQVVAMIHLYN